MSRAVCDAARGARPGGQSSYNVFGIAVPMHLVPFGSLIFTSIIIPKASFLGHLAGILAGYLIGFGFLDWTNIWMSTGLFLALLGGRCRAFHCVSFPRKCC
jgi:Rhomboid family